MRAQLSIELELELELEPRRERERGEPGSSFLVSARRREERKEAVSLRERELRSAMLGVGVDDGIRGFGWALSDSSGGVRRSVAARSKRG